MKTTDEILYDIMVDLEQREATPLNQIRKKLLVLSTPRSGSTLFCEVLSATDLIGECREWLNQRYFQAYAKVTGEPQVQLSRYIDFVAAKTVGSTGIFAVNMHVEQYMFLMKQSFDALSIGFDLIVSIERRDKLAQAISLAKANATDQWSHNTKALSESSGPGSLEIAAALHHLLASNENYKRHLKEKVSHEYVYEDFVTDDDYHCYRQVLAGLGLEVEGIRFAESSLTKQGNKDSERRKVSFLNYIQGQSEDFGLSQN